MSDFENVQDTPPCLYDSKVYGYDIDTTPFGGSVLHFHPGLNEFNQPLVWGGVIYQPLPISIEGIEYDPNRSVRPILTVSKMTEVGGTPLGRLVKMYEYLNGAKVTRRSTLGKFLDAANFISGNPNANPAIQFPKETYVFERMAEETSTYIKFELTSVLDAQGAMIPKRDYSATVCPWEYKGEICKYALENGMFDENDQPTTDPLKDACGRRVSSCECRKGKGNWLPCGIFPGLALISRG